MVWVGEEFVVVDRYGVVKVAVPAALTVPEPIVAEPSMNVTLPVGVPEAGGFTATFAVKVTGWPQTDGLLLDVITVVVGTWFPTACRTLDVLVRKFPSPP